MSLTLPGTEELDTFSHGRVAEDFDDEQQVQALQQAADLLFLATRVETDPESETVLRIVKWGILDMAWSLLIKTENKAEYYSPFSSEHIGSYSYSKAAGQVARGLTTDVMWFDAALKLLREEDPDGSVVWSTTEHVFTQPFEESENVINLHDFFGA